MDEQKQKIVERIAQAQNILVTVSANPSVDQLSAAIGLTLVLNQMGKHATAVFSGAVPSTMEFLKPEDTLEKNTDSLRDFIIALDKSKADKLRYKVEDEVVRIFITPYKTSLSEKDLEFSQGDFNVDVVLCLGVTEQEDLDKAITAHGRILHDATVVSVSTTGQGSLGSINWVAPAASSLCEMMVGLSDALDKKALTNQVATAFLTGIVATTERFRNDKTSPQTMSAAAALMSAGANQQLIATELETPPPQPERQEIDESGSGDQKSDEPQTVAEHKPDPGTLEIHHDEANPEAKEEPEHDSHPNLEMPEHEDEPQHPQIHVDDDGQLLMGDQLPQISQVKGVAPNGEPIESDGHGGKVEVHRELLTSRGPEMDTGSLTANTEPEQLDPAAEELTLPALQEPLLRHNESVLPPLPGAAPTSAALPPLPDMPSALPPLSLPPAPAAAPLPPLPSEPPAAATPQPTPLPLPPLPTTPTPPPVSTPPPLDDHETLAQIEQSVDSPHLQAQDGGAPVAAPAAPDAAENVDSARSAVEAALTGADGSNPLEPIAALNAQPLGPELHHEQASEQPSPSATAAPTNLFAPAPSLPAVPNTGFSEPTPGNTPADSTLDMPLPNPTFAQPATLPAASAFPGSLPPSLGAQTPPPPVPPPMFPPLS
ncbi:MAG TPA: hypothetical protein VLF69_04980 [Candidatus Saccharimonadales bacterium]|nr:hypothetical protein [Candidatus Saccharimonadales bacterium]